MRLIFFLLAAFVLASCNPTVTGNGNIVQVTREVPNFQNLENLGSFDVEIQPGNNYALKIVGDDNLIPYVMTEVKDGSLQIYYKKNTNIANDHVHVVVTCPFLNSIETAGSGDIRSTGIIANNKMIEISSLGSGDMDMTFDAPALKFKGAGSGNFKASGQTRDVDCVLAGSGSFDGKDLKSENAKINITGSGSVKIFASVTLSANITGSGEILYWGNPSLKEVKVAGSGKVKAGE